jgi:hypothetical protein
VSTVGWFADGISSASPTIVMKTIMDNRPLPTWTWVETERGGQG